MKLSAWRNLTNKLFSYFEKQVCHFLIFSLVRFPAIVLLIIALSTQSSLVVGDWGKLLQASSQLSPAPVSHPPPVPRPRNGHLISANLQLISLAHQLSPPSRLKREDRNLQCRHQLPGMQGFPQEQHLYEQSTLFISVWLCPYSNMWVTSQQLWFVSLVHGSVCEITVLKEKLTKLAFSPQKNGRLRVSLRCTTLFYFIFIFFLFFFY